jgi:hypothetical protein
MTFSCALYIVGTEGTPHGFCGKRGTYISQLELAQSIERHMRSGRRPHSHDKVTSNAYLDDDKVVSDVLDAATPIDFVGPRISERRQAYSDVRARA